MLESYHYRLYPNKKQPIKWCDFIEKLQKAQNIICTKSLTQFSEKPNDSCGDTDSKYGRASTT